MTKFFILLAISVSSLIATATTEPKAAADTQCTCNYQNAYGVRSFVLVYNHKNIKYFHFDKFKGKFGALKACNAAKHAACD